MNHTSEPEIAILVVDDEPDVRDALCRALRSSRYDVCVAADATEALALLRKRRFDILLSDYEMPDIDGLALLQRVRIQHPQLLRVLLTGKADLHIAVRALNEGAADRFLLKPWDRFDLEGVLRLTLHARAGRRGERR